MKRHAQSASAQAEGSAQAGGDALLPEPELDAGFNEFDHRAVFENYSRSNAQRE
jgi:hypothetical protein